MLGAAGSGPGDPYPGIGESGELAISTLLMQHSRWRRDRRDLRRNGFKAGKGLELQALHGVMKGLGMRLHALRPAWPELAGIRRGIEKESLRIDSDGRLSQRPHLPALGSPLTHPHITTDFSEAQLELVTDAHGSPEACIRQLEEIHGFTHQCLAGELLWAASMPCIAEDESRIPLGRYGTSNIAKAKTVYRRGLGHRYGRRMQTISGIHYNFSLSAPFWQRYAALFGRPADRDFITECYFGLIRNFRRRSWLLIYLFGASPALCRSFLGDGSSLAAGDAHGLQAFDEATLHLPHATSLRMGRLGYQSDAQGSLHISYNGMDSYARTMHRALTQPYPPYQAIGLKADGEYQQLSTALLQIENEFYGAIRPKPPFQSGERPLTMLKRRGVEYVEVRCLDLDPFLPAGIDQAQIRFLDSFLLACLLAESPEDSREESETMRSNQLVVVERGRQPGLRLGGEPLEASAGAILEQCASVAELLDEAQGTDLHAKALREQRERLANPERTPSARVLAAMRKEKASFFRFALNRSIAHRRHFKAFPPSGSQLARHRAAAQRSLADQAAIEARDQVEFDAFLESYLQLPL